MKRIQQSTALAPLICALALLVGAVALAGCAVQPAPAAAAPPGEPSAAASAASAAAAGTAAPENENPAGAEPDNAAPEGAAASAAAAGERISVVATIFPPFDFSRAIAGDKADIAMLLPPGAESHSFEPTPQDIIKIQNCDVFIYNGGDSDAWVGEILESMDTGSMKIVRFIDCVETVDEEIVEGMEDVEHEHEDGHEDGDEHEDEDGHEGEDGHEDEHEGEHEREIDEHVWTSPRNAKLIVGRISDALRSADPKNADAYSQSADAYLARLDELDAKFKAVTGGAARNTIVFGDRFPFRYFADAYGLEYFAAFPGCATETEASAATVAFLIDKISAERIPAVFHIELSNEKMANAISESTGAKVMLLHACHNISKADFEAGETYISLMDANADTLKEALS
jgi:zinc transport system substrate-binding protein